MYDLMKVIFRNGFNTHIINEDNDINLLPIQMDFLKLLKSLFHPNKSIYMIKNSCLAYNKIDKERQNMVNKTSKLITQVYNIYNENNPDIYNNIDVKKIVNKYDDLLAKHLSHIDNWKEKILTKNFDEFTMTRMKTIFNTYTTIYNLLEKY